MRVFNFAIQLCLSIALFLFFTCTNNMDQLYIVSASHSAFPSGVPIDENGDGQVDGLDITQDGIIDMRFLAPVSIPATGIDINEDGVADFFMYTTANGSTFNSLPDGTGGLVTVVISGGVVSGYDTNSDGIVDIGIGTTVSSIGGTATGITSDVILTLMVNGIFKENITVSADGAFTFASTLNNGYFYQVTMSTTQLCSISNDSGVVGASDITNIAVTCGNLTVGGTITGPATIGTLMLSMTINNTTTEFLTIPAASSPITFTFTSKLNTGTFYSVLIVSSTDVCVISSNSGTVASIDITDVAVTCSQYTVAGTITPALTSSMMLSLSVNNLVVENKTVAAASTSFAFAKKLFNGEVYNVQISSTTQNCTISNNIGTISSANITNVAINCGQYLAGVNISSGSVTPGMILSLSINGVFKENKTITATGVAPVNPYNFATNLLTGDIYSIEIVSSTLDCTILGNSGTMAAANITATITCAQYTVGGTITPSLTSSMILSLSVNSVIVENLTKPATSAGFTFTTKLFDAQVYEVQIVSTTQNCTISSNVGTITAGNVSSVAVNCGSYTTGGTILPALTADMVLSLTVNGSFIKNVTRPVSSTTFDFSTLLLSGDVYNIQIQSTTQSCRISNNSGTVSANVSATVTCAEFTIGNSGIVGVPVNPDDRISGLTSGNSVTLSLYVNGTFQETMTVTKSTPTTDTTFTFPNTKLFSGDAYNVQIGSSTQSCKISSSTGTIAAANITNVSVVCAQYTVGNTTQPIVGFTGGNVTVSLSVNGTFVESLPVAFPATTFTFSTKLYTNDAYYVQILTSTQSCKISSNTGTIAAANITNVAITCARDIITMTLNHPGGGAIALTGDIILSLTVNGLVVENKTILSSAIDGSTHDFATQIYGGDVYNVQIVTSTDNCEVSAGIGTAPGTGAIAVGVDCGRYRISGSVDAAGVGGANSCSAGTVTLIAQLFNGTLSPEVINVDLVPASAVAYGPTSTRFLANDIYAMELSYTGLGTCTRCSFVDLDPGSGTVISTNGQFSGADITNINVYCW